MITRKRAIKLCIELWTWLAKTGKRKTEWPDWEKYGKAYNDCWFCEYGMQQENRYESNKACCEYCPLYLQFELEGCYNGLCAYNKWNNAKIVRIKKKYAKLFLEQIKKSK